MRKIKNYLLPVLILIFTFCLILFSSSNLVAAKEGLKLWANSVIPSLFPFFVATELLSRTNIPYLMGKLLNKFMKPIFNVRGEGSFAFIMGIISGYPVGAKIATNFRKNQVLTKEECERLLSFTNNSGPLFIIGTVGISMFGNTMIGILLIITHILACLTVGILFRFWKNDAFNKSNPKLISSPENQISKLSISNLGEAIADSISHSASTIIMIGGFVVIFSVIISILHSSHFLILVSNSLTPIFEHLHFPTEFISPIFTGFLEITNGISTISNIKIKAMSINIIISAFLLGFGGISVLLQVWSITSKSDLSIKPYIIGKCLHGLIAALYTFLFIQIFPFFNFNI